MFFLLLHALSWKAQKSSLFCGATLEVWEHDPILFIPNLGYKSILLHSLELLQNISNQTRSAKANPD